MKLSNFIIPLFAVIIIIYYSQSVENFQTSTFDTLLNLPRWMVYLAILILMFGALVTMFAQIYPWIVGLQTARHGINAASSFGSKWINAKYTKPTQNVYNKKPTQNVYNKS